MKGRRKAALFVLPDALNSVLLKNRIGRRDRHTFLHGLSSEKSIKRIAVMKGKTANPRYVPKFGRKNREAVCGHLLGHESVDRLRDFQFAETLLDGHLPARCHAQKALIAFVGDRVACPAAKRIIIANPPKKRVRIEQQFHRVYSAKSSGVASKSSASVTLPRAEPGVRLAGGDSTGTNFRRG